MIDINFLKNGKYNKLKNKIKHCISKIKGGAILQ